LYRHTAGFRSRCEKFFKDKTKLSQKPYSIEATRQETKVCCPYFVRREETFVKLSRDFFMWLVK